MRNKQLTRRRSATAHKEDWQNQKEAAFQTREDQRTDFVNERLSIKDHYEPLLERRRQEIAALALRTGVIR